MTRKATQKPKETPAVPKAARDLRKGNSDAALAMVERKKIISLEKKVAKLEDQVAGLKQQIRAKPAASKRKK